MTFDFWAWFDKRESEANATDDGKRFTAAGFELHHTGGGCTAWLRQIPDSEWHLLVTAGDGCSHELATDIPDCWLIGAHSRDGAWTACREGATVDDALRHADEMQALIAAGNLESMGVENA
jgi:hypothetical protein